MGRSPRYGGPDHKPKDKNVAAARRSSKAVDIPEEIQEPMRRRLRLIRESRGISREGVKSLSSGTVSNYELHDLSTMRLGDLYGLAVEFGTTVEELLQYLFGEIDEQPTQESRRVQRMLVYLRSLPEHQQDLACDIVQQIVAHRVNAVGEPVRAPKRNARAEIKATPIKS